MDNHKTPFSLLDCPRQQMEGAKWNLALVQRVLVGNCAKISQDVFNVSNFAELVVLFAR